jgi:hypothetical protein
MRELRPIIPVPAPTGSDLDNLLDTACTTIENTFRSYKTPAGQKRLSPELCTSDGQHSTVLTDGMTSWSDKPNKGHAGIRSWITSGTLRSVDELPAVLNAFLSDMTKKLRLRQVSPDWQFDNDALIILSSRFGLPAPRTFEELKEKRTADDTERERQNNQRQTEEKERYQVYLASPEYAEKKRLDDIHQSKEERVRDTLLLMVPYVTFKDPENRTRDELIEADIAHEDREYLKKYVEYIVEHTSFAPSTIAQIWREAEDGYKETVELVEGTKYEDELKTLEVVAVENILRTAKEHVEFGSCELPELQEGERRLRFTWDELMAFMGTSEYSELLDTNDLVTMLGNDGLFAIDVIAKSKDMVQQ